MQVAGAVSQEARLEVQIAADLAPQPSKLFVHVMHPLEGSGAYAWRQALEAHLLLSGMAKACLQVSPSFSYCHPPPLYSLTMIGCYENVYQ